MGAPELRHTRNGNRLNAGEKAKRYPYGMDRDLGDDFSGRMPIVPHEIDGGLRASASNAAILPLTLPYIGQFNRRRHISLVGYGENNNSSV